MNVWCHLPTIINRRFALRIAGLLSLCVALTTTLIFASVATAASDINRTISFQGRLFSDTGTVVPDGYYNIQFKIYQDGAGTAAGNPGGSLEWTETRINNGGNNGVFVRNGYFSVSLGSVTPFGTSVDWNQDTLWLSMNIAGSALNCTSFGSGACAADGEMLPMKQMTASPYAMNAGALNGKTAENFVQLGQGVQEDASFNTSVSIAKTGSGNFFELFNQATNVLTIEQDGDLIFGGVTNQNIVVGENTANTNGSNLNIQAGTGGTGDSTSGGTLTLQGGNSSSTNGHGGWVSIHAGAASGSGNAGKVLIGEYETGEVRIGTLSEARTQTINVGANNTAGSTTNVTVGSGGSAAGGTTSIQSKDDTTFSTDGTQRARFSGDSNTLYVGNADSSGNATTANSFTIQGTHSTGSSTQGGSINLLGGNGTSGNANGGNIHISGGNGSGTGSKGMVVIDTPAFASASTQTSATDANVTQSSIDGFGVITLNASATNVHFTLGAPSLGSGAAGRIVYVTAANGSSNFILRTNVGGGTGIEQAIPMRPNTTATLIWSGSIWTVAGSAGGGSLQTAYDNLAQSAGDAAIVTVNTTSQNGLIIRDSSNLGNRTVLSVQSAGSTPLFSVNSLKPNELAKNPGGETAGSSASRFETDTWKNSDNFGGDDHVGDDGFDSTISRYTTPGNNIFSGNASVRVDATDAPYTGARNHLNSTLTPGVSYNISVKVRAESASLNDFAVYLFPNGVHGEPWTWCTGDVDVTSSAWTNISCTFTAPSTVTSQNHIFLTPNAQTGIFYVDDLSVTRTNAMSNVQVGGDGEATDPTFLTLGKSASSPADIKESLLGSMYYDTTLGKVQCLEADGWGACSNAPDTFVTLSPEFAGAVTNGSGTGTMTTDICSDTLNINDGSSAQPTVCDTNETYNFYNWTAADPTNSQTKSLYVTYQLPANFKNFVENQTSLLGRLSNTTDAGINYQVYRNNSESGLTACGSTSSVNTANDWQKVLSDGGDDPADCDFEAGDSIVFRINMSAKNDADAYVSNLSFVYSNK